MKFRAVVDSEWRALQQPIQYQQAVSTKVSGFLEKLSEVFNEKTVGGLSGISIVSETLGPARATVTTPYGNARFVFQWHIGEREPLGRLVLQREQLDEMDRIFWQPVWGIYVPAFEGLYIEKDTVLAQEGLNSSAGNSWRKGVFETGMIMLLAIVKGPLVSSKA
jgi:hypothetical protein